MTTPHDKPKSLRDYRAISEPPGTHAPETIAVAKYLELFARQIDAESSVPMLPQGENSWIGFTYPARQVRSILRSAPPAPAGEDTESILCPGCEHYYMLPSGICTKCGHVLPRVKGKQIGEAVLEKLRGGPVAPSAPAGELPFESVTPVSIPREFIEAGEKPVAGAYTEQLLAIPGTEQPQRSRFNCPECGRRGQRRRGVHFDHEYICGYCNVTWDPNERPGPAAPSGEVDPIDATPDEQWILAVFRNQVSDSDWERLKRIAERLRRTEHSARQVARFLNDVIESQQQMLDVMRVEGFVFKTDLRKPDPNETERWEKLAFTLYTELVELSSKADQLREDALSAYAALAQTRPTDTEDGTK